MGDTALFIGWGSTHPGREPTARRHFAQWVEILERLKAAGEIEGYEHVLLAPHGGELDGFTLVHGTPEHLARIQARDDLRTLQRQASLDHGRFGVVWAITGAGVERELDLTADAMREYEREPALVV